MKWILSLCWRLLDQIGTKQLCGAGAITSKSPALSGCKSELMFEPQA